MSARRVTACLVAKQADCYTTRVRGGVVVHEHELRGVPACVFT